MNIQLTDEQEAVIRQAIAGGRLGSADEAVKQAFDLWSERERGRAAFLASVDEAKTEIARGDGIPISPESVRDLTEDIKRRGRERLAAI